MRDWRAWGFWGASPQPRQSLAEEARGWSSAGAARGEQARGHRLGSRRWPRTLAGITAYQPCLQHPFAAGPAGVGSAGEQQAWRRCDRTGRWEDGDYSHCLYTNDITRVLYTFVLVSGGLRGSAGPWGHSR